MCGTEERRLHESLGFFLGHIKMNAKDLTYYVKYTASRVPITAHISLDITITGTDEPSALHEITDVFHMQAIGGVRAHAVFLCT